MSTAFGRAMLDSINNPPPRSFRMNMLGGPSMEMSCDQFLDLRQEERRLLDSIELSASARVLDYGCGAGRHLRYLRDRQTTIECCGIDVCELLLDHCRRTIPQPAAFFRSWGDITRPSFDLILLMGNGLGVLGNEQNALAMLKLFVASLRPAGRVIIETGNPFGSGYRAAEFTIDYHGLRDGPFAWGYADREWLFDACRPVGCRVDFARSSALGGIFFLADIRLADQGAPLDAHKDARR